MTRYAAFGELVNVEEGPLMEYADHFMILEEKRVEIEDLKKQLENALFKAQCLEEYVQDLLE